MYYTENAYPNALRLIVESVQSEREDELFYDYLLSLAPTEEQREIIASIRDDERKHNKMFREIYYELTGLDIPPLSGMTFQPPASYLGECCNNPIFFYPIIFFKFFQSKFRHILATNV
jgi:hypothetical protein